MAQLKLQDRIDCPIGSVEKCLQGGDGNERFSAKDAVVPAPAGGNSAEERTIAILALVGIATVLMTSPIEQVEAQTTTNRNKRIVPARPQPSTSPTNSPRRNMAPPPRPTYKPSTNRVSRPPLRRTTPSTNQVSRPIPNRNRVVPSRTILTTTRRTIPSRNQATMPQAKKKPGNPPTTPPGRGVGDGIAPITSTTLSPAIK